jgi:hypothetical protein
METTLNLNVETKLTIKKVIPETVMIWHDDHGFIGEANEYEFNLFRIEIKKNKLNGYYVLKDENCIYINQKGQVESWEFFKLMEETLDELSDW